MQKCLREIIYTSIFSEDVFTAHKAAVNVELFTENFAINFHLWANKNCKIINNEWHYHNNAFSVSEILELYKTQQNVKV